MLITLSYNYSLFILLRGADKHYVDSAFAFCFLVPVGN